MDIFFSFINTLFIIVNMAKFFSLDVKSVSTHSLVIMIIIDLKSVWQMENR